MKPVVISSVVAVVAVLVLAQVVVGSPLDDQGRGDGEVELVGARSNNRRDYDFGDPLGDDEGEGPKGAGDVGPGGGGPAGPFGFGFRPWLEEGYGGFQNFIESMRRLITGMMRRPFSRPGFGFDIGGEDDFGANLPDNYDNSTYTTKVVNGSVVAVNETIKRHKTNNTNYYYHVRVVNLLPKNASDQNTTASGVGRQPEPNSRVPAGNDEHNDVNTAKRFRREA